VIGNGSDGVLQYFSHAALIESNCPLKSSADTRLDAILVPAARPAENLQTAVKLATETGARLVVLCSFRTRADEVRALLAEHSLTSPVVVEMPRQRDTWVLWDFETARWIHDGPGKGLCGPRNSDLSMKRNAGLLLARMLGWERIFFLDDDIRGISTDAVLSTVSLLGRAGRGYRTAGMPVTSYPDNSSVCHARREVGEYQDVFVSGSVLAVDSSAPFDFFPDLYNEDWLFFYRDVAEGRLVKPHVVAAQLPYDPFADPQRAAGQEFGDVIAEGLYALLHYGHGADAAHDEYWMRFLEHRNRVQHDVIRHLQNARPELRKDLNSVMGAAQQVLCEINPAACADYVCAWQLDLNRWENLLGSLPHTKSIKDALQTIGLLPLARSFHGG
jgi:hypothetical protein